MSHPDFVTCESIEHENCMGAKEHRTPAGAKQKETSKGTSLLTGLLPASSAASAALRLICPLTFLSFMWL